MAHRADALVDLVAGQLPALAGLRTLRHLDLDIVRIGKIFGGHAKATAGHLLDLAAHRIAIGQRHEAFGLLPAFAGVRAPADPVHRDGERGMGLVADRTEAHRPGAEPLDDLRGGLNLVERDRHLGLGQHHQPADRQQPFGLFVDRLREFRVLLPLVAAHRVLELGDIGRGPGVLLAAQAILVHPADIQHVAVDRIVAIGGGSGGAPSPAPLRPDRCLRWWWRCG